VANAISRISHEIHIASINMYMTDLKDKIIATTNSDKHYLKLKETLQQGNLQWSFKYFELKEDGIIIYKGKACVLNFNELKNAVMREMHNVPYDGHPRYQKIIAIVRSQYFFLGMKK
jgi:hypothetical protein